MSETFGGNGVTIYVIGSGSDADAMGGMVSKTRMESKSEDYSSYLLSLDSYCREWGYTMPEVKGSDYHSAYSAWSYVNSQWNADHKSASASRTSHVNDSDPYYDFVPITYADGSVVFYDQNGHGEVDAARMSNGLYHLSGRKSIVTAIGGRGEFDTIIRHLADDKYFNDGKTD